MGKHDPVITYYQAARIHAQAWYEDPTVSGSKANGFKDSLDKDPYAALASNTGTPPITRRDSFGIHANAKLIALDSYNEDFGDIDFDDYDGPELTQIYQHGVDPNGNHLTMRPSLWITPSGKITEVGGQNPVGISLADWARIYAYIFFQDKFATTKTSIKVDFETDPATALIKYNITQTLNIIYTHGGTNPTPLITHGDPPKQDPGEPSFQAISNDPNAKGYRYIVRFSC